FGDPTRGEHAQERLAFVDSGSLRSGARTGSASSCWNGRPSCGHERGPGVSSGRPPARVPRDLVRHSQRLAEFVVDEAGDTAASIALKARLAVVLGRRERVLPFRGENVALPTGVAHEDLPLTADDHPAVGAGREPILADELVEHPGADTAG